MKLEPVAWTHESYLPPTAHSFAGVKNRHPSFPVALYAIPDGYVVVPVSKLGALELENKMLEAANEAAGKIESLLRQRLQDVRMYLLAEADKHTPRDPILGEAYQMTQRHLEWCPAAAKGQS